VSGALDRVRELLAAREAAGLRRFPKARPAHETVLDLAGNDYLGLTHDRRVTSAAGEAARTWGAGATGSRLVTGTIELHLELEQRLASFMGSSSALVFGSGYAANLAVVTALAGPDVTVVADASNHASLIDACRLTRSPVEVVPHRDVAAIGRALTGRETEHALVVTDSVFSVDGDLAPLAALHAASRAHGALLIVDEAHALGVVGDGGRGGVHAAGIAGEPDVVQTVTLSKSLAAQGGAVIGDPAVTDLLISTARTFIFDTGLAPASAGAALAALDILIAEPDLPFAVRSNADALAAIVAGLGVETVKPDAAVVPAILGDPLRAVAAAAACLELGVRVGCFRPPSVPEGRSCLRLTSRADLRTADLEQVQSVLTTVLL
jgi:8-amino-7-oxononanoate synthase